MPASAAIPIAPSDVAIAERSSSRVKSSSSGTMISPPPTPKSAPKNPAARPIGTSRSTARIVWPCASSTDSVEAPRLAAVLLDIDGTLAPIVDRPEDSAVPEETRVVLRGLVERYGLVGAVTGRPGSLGRELVSVEGVEVVGSHGLELDDGADEWRTRLAGVPADGRLARRGQGPRALVPLPHRTTTRRLRGPTSRESPSARETQVCARASGAWCSR